MPLELDLTHYNHEQVRAQMMVFGAGLAEALIPPDFLDKLVAAKNRFNSVVEENFNGKKAQTSFYMHGGPYDVGPAVFLALGEGLEELIRKYFQADIAHRTSDFRLNQTVVNQYPVGGWLRPHYDSPSELISCIPIIEGIGDFVTYPHAEYDPDISGRLRKFDELDAVTFSAMPGDVIFMRETGLAGNYNEEFRVCHSVRNITEPRTTVVYRPLGLSR